MDLQRLFAYDDWANREEVARLRDVDSDRAVRLLAHIVGTQGLWLARLRNETPKMAIWPELTLEECSRELDPLKIVWRDFLISAPLHSSIEYTNTKGEKWSSRVDDVLLHIVFHGSYHRGQIATAVRAAGKEPAYTDYIQCTRTGAI